MLLGESMSEDANLLSRYLSEDSEDSEMAFRELVDRHIDLVYSAALRQTGDPEMAKDVVQTVFCDLARQARRLSGRAILAGWLYRGACFAAAKAIRTESRRRAREKAAMELHMPEVQPEPDWESLRPLLDGALGELSEIDRDALLLRFFEKKPLSEVGTELGASEDGARKRVDRALDRLRGLLQRRGFLGSASALATALAAHGSASAPSGLASATAATAIAGSHAAAGAFSAMLKPINAITMTKSQVLSIGGALLGAAFAIHVAYHHHVWPFHPSAPMGQIRQDPSNAGTFSLTGSQQSGNTASSGYGTGSAAAAK